MIPDLELIVYRTAKLQRLFRLAISIYLLWIKNNVIGSRNSNKNKLPKYKTVNLSKIANFQWNILNKKAIKQGNKWIRQIKGKILSMNNRRTKLLKMWMKREKKDQFIKKIKFKKK